MFYSLFELISDFPNARCGRQGISGREQKRDNFKMHLSLLFWALQVRARNLIALQVNLKWRRWLRMGRKLWVYILKLRRTAQLRGYDMKPTDLMSKRGWSSSGGSLDSCFPHRISRSLAELGFPHDQWLRMKANGVPWRLVGDFG